MSAIPNLLPCPICGGEVWMEDEEMMDEWTSIIHCDCGIMFAPFSHFPDSYDAENYVARLWNRRVDGRTHED